MVVDERAARALARLLPHVMSQETCDAVMGPGLDPLDVATEWYMPPMELATAMIERMEELRLVMVIAPREQGQRLREAIKEKS